MFKFANLFVVLSGLVFFSGCSVLSLEPTCQMKAELVQKGQIQVHVLNYHRSDAGPKSLIIIPPTGGTNYIDRSYAELFCRHGYNVAIMDWWTGDTESTYELEIHQRFYDRTQKAITVVIEDLRKAHPATTIGLIGSSVGGLHASIAASVQNELNAVFAIVAGISIAEVVVKSDQTAMVALKAERKRMYGFKTDDEQIAAIHKAFHLEPEELGEGFKNKRLGMSLAQQDTTVVYSGQQKLERLWHPSVVITTGGSHFWGIVNTWLFHSSEILKFFEDSQKPKNADSELKS